MTYRNTRINYRKIWFWQKYQSQKLSKQKLEPYQSIK
nr:MAG TPA: hypothetical protein [Caudoviricetes sp.]DAL59619.1 MAG TPA_asm: hypothetical protein [Caudoviricetes sp.]